MANTDATVKKENPAYITEAEKLWAEKSKELAESTVKERKEFLKEAQSQAIEFFKEELKTDRSGGGYDWRIASNTVKATFFKTAASKLYIKLMYLKTGFVEMGCTSCTQFGKFSWCFDGEKGLIVTAPSGKKFSVSYEEMSFEIHRS